MSIIILHTRDVNISPILESKWSHSWLILSFNWERNILWRIKILSILQNKVCNWSLETILFEIEISFVLLTNDLPSQKDEPSTISLIGPLKS